MKQSPHTALAALLALLSASCDANTPPGASSDAMAEAAADAAPDVATPDVTSPDVTAPDVAQVDTPVAVDMPVAMDMPVGADATPDVAADADAMAMVGAYPAGPYGRNQGQTLANLSWEGYTNLDGAVVSTMRPFAPTSMQAVRETGRAYALVHVSEFF